MPNFKGKKTGKAKVTSGPKSSKRKPKPKAKKVKRY